MVTIYALTCSANGFAYIGCTKGPVPASLSKRFREHRCLLNKGTHTATKLVADWKAYGPTQFMLVSLESLPDSADKEQKRHAEMKWMRDYESRGRLYNAHMVSFQPTPAAMERGIANAHRQPGNRWTDEANLKRSLAQKGKPKGHGAKISATKRARQAMR